MAPDVQPRFIIAYSASAAYAPPIVLESIAITSGYEASVASHSSYMLPVAILPMGLS